MNMLKEWGITPGARIFADSSAALGVVHRKESGKLRHIRVNMLWVQDKRANGKLNYQKIEGSDNLGDLMTKYLGSGLMKSHLESLMMKVRGGRAKEGLTA